LQKFEHEKALLADLHDIEHKKARSFSILPLCGSNARHTTIDTTVLHGLLTRVVERTGSSRSSGATSWTTIELTWPRTSTSARRREAGETMRGAPASGC
jgi:hypothetical protein